jgi:SAM-dependent methyltransferase
MDGLTARGGLSEQWDRLSSAYQRNVRISVEEVHYGPCGPGERALGLLGDISGKKVLELGCGGGQNCVALSRLGGHATGVDFSVAQLRYARELNDRHGTSARFVQLDLQQTDLPEQLDHLGGAAGRDWDIVISSFAVEYVASFPGLLASVHALLRPGGRLVLCDLHPFASSADIVGATVPGVIGSLDYFDRQLVHYTWPVRTVDGFRAIPMYRFHRTISAYMDALLTTGFELRALHEPRVAEPHTAKDCTFPYHDETIGEQYDVWRMVPYTVIFAADRKADDP